MADETTIYSAKHWAAKAAKSATAASATNSANSATAAASSATSAQTAQTKAQALAELCKQLANAPEDQAVDISALNS